MLGTVKTNSLPEKKCLFLRTFFILHMCPGFIHSVLVFAMEFISPSFLIITENGFSLRPEE